MATKVVEKTANKTKAGTDLVKQALPKMLKGGVIMDVVNAEQAKIAEAAGAVAVMALERVPADIRAQGGVARMSDPELIIGIKNAVTIPVMAKVRIGHFVEAGPIGGDLSHEFIVLAPTGESEVFYDAAFEEFDWNQADLQYGDSEGLQRLFDQVSSTYSATDETHDEARWASIAEDRRRTGRGIEVGHIFYFGDKYSNAMGLKVSGADGRPVTPMMGSYGVGVSRLVGARAARLRGQRLRSADAVGGGDRARRCRAPRQRGAGVPGRTARSAAGAARRIAPPDRPKGLDAGRGAATMPPT